MKIMEVNSTDIKLDDIEKANEDFDSICLMDVEIDDEDKERGFAGNALLYDECIYINTFTGEGYELVVNKMRKYIDWYSGKIRLSGFEREDIKQLIVLMLLDGIRRYNPELKIKLSTFLYVHIKNRMISRIKEETRQSLNATYNEPSSKFICPCGTAAVLNKNDALNYKCISCKIVLDENWLIRAEHHEPISLDGIMSAANSDDDSADNVSSRIDYSGKKNSFIDFFGKIDTTEDVDHSLDFSNILREEDITTKKIAELMYHDDYSITDAANEVGLTCWAASLRLKKLKNKKHIQEFFIDNK